MSCLSFVARSAGLAFLLVALAPPAAKADAAVGTVRLEYDLNLSGLPIAEILIDLTLKEGSYVVRGSGQTVGLVDLFSKVRFSGQSSGLIRAGVARPQTHNYVYSERDKTRKVALDFDDAQMPSVTATPPFTESPDRIPLPAEKLAGVLDIASQFILPAAVGSSPLAPDNCDRTYGVSDGRVRVDATITHVESAESAAIRGTPYKGPFLHCAATIHPVGGHKVGGMLSKLEGNGAIDVWVAPTLNERFLIPVKVSVPTSFGTAHLVMRRISTLPASRQAGLGG